ncbi:Phage integrase family protein [Pseudomonas fluorescens]|nr:Phage integrase family protein [Pseudomonas fluorescens]
MMSMPILAVSPASEKLSGAVFLSSMGYEFDPGSDHWRLSKDVSFRTDTLPARFGPELMGSFKNVLAQYAKSHSPQHTRAMYSRLKHYLDGTSEHVPLSVESFISYRSQLGEDDWMLSSIRSMLNKWSSLGYPGVPDDTLRLLKKWKIKGNRKGYAVQSMCPESGPLTDIEMDALISKLLEGYANDSVSLRDACYVMILSMTGRRSSQISALKIKDLVPENGYYWIAFPRVKQKNSGWRKSFRKLRVIEDLWLLLQRKAETVIADFQGLVGAELPAHIIKELPLFPVLNAYDPALSLHEQLAGDFLHARTNEVYESLQLFTAKNTVISERTGEALHLHPYRFRYTLGTNLAREGKGEYLIAEALDHSDTQNTGVYVKNIPDIVERIDKAVALQLAPLAQAFQGIVVASEASAKRGKDPDSRVYSPRGNVGSCGSYGFCGALAPIACYTCSHFQPWLDGPHEAVLDGLISDRDRVYVETGDLKIAAVNDRLILAVSDVVTRCNEMRIKVKNV